MRIAVVGAGISGIGSAHALQGHADVTLFEAGPRLGGHTDTHRIETPRGRYAVDSGFIVYNRINYPLFSAFLDTLGVDSQPSDMSFGVSDPCAGIEYGTGSVRGLLGTPRLALSIGHIGMLADLRRFYRDAPRDLEEGVDGTLGSYLSERRYGDAFIYRHIGPM